MTSVLDPRRARARKKKIRPAEKTFQRWRFRLAHWLDRDPRRCWVELCLWALYGGERSLRDACQPRPGCAAEKPCYCGKNGYIPEDNEPFAF